MWRLKWTSGLVVSSQRQGCHPRRLQAVGDRYEFETDFIIRAAHAGFCITNVPISTIYGPPSYFREVKDAMRVIGVLWSHRSGAFSKPVPRPVTPVKRDA